MVRVKDVRDCSFREEEQVSISLGANVIHSINPLRLATARVDLCTELRLAIGWHGGAMVCQEVASSIPGRDFVI